jgi:ribosomal protein L27
MTDGRVKFEHARTDKKRVRIVAEPAQAGADA